MILLYILTVALGGYLAWRWHTSAVLLLVLLLPATMLRVTIGGVPVAIWEALVLVTTLLGFMQPRVRQGWKHAANALPSMGYALLGVFLLAVLVSTAISAERYVSLGILKGWIVIPMLVGWLVYTAARERTSHRAFVHTLIISGAAVAAVSLFSYAPPARLVGWFDVPNSLALWLSPIVALSLARLLRGEEQQYGRRSLYGVSFVMGIALMATQSVGGVFSALISVLLTYLYWATHKVFVVTLLAVVVVSGFFFYVYSSPSQKTFAVRQQLWSVAGDLLLERPILGLGLGQFEPHYQRKLHERFFAHEQDGRESPHTKGEPPLREFVYRDPHNWLLSFWLNTGVFGVVSFVWMYVIGLRRALKVRSGLGASLLAFALFGLVDTVYWKNDLAALYWVMFALSATAPAPPLE